MTTELEAHEGWLRKRWLFPEHKVQFFAGWVERFLRLRSIRPAEAWQDTWRVFLEDLGKAGTRAGSNGRQPIR